MSETTPLAEPSDTTSNSEANQVPRDSIRSNRTQGSWFQCALSLILLPNLAGCALTMTNTFNVIGERGQTGEVVVPTNHGTAAVPVTEFYYDMENNFFYTLEFKSRINEDGHTDVGHAMVILDDLTWRWQPTTAIMDGKPVIFEARLNSLPETGYELQIRRDFSRWYAYPANAAAIAVAPIDLAKNITTNTGLLSLVMVTSMFMDIGFIAPTGGMGL